MLNCIISSLPFITDCLLVVLEAWGSVVLYDTLDADTDLAKTGGLYA